MLGFRVELLGFVGLEFSVRPWTLSHLVGIIVQPGYIGLAVEWAEFRVWG